MPEVLYEEVIEVDERVVLKQDGCLLPRKDRKRVVTGVQMISPHTLLECFVLGFFGASSKYNQWGITLFALRPIQEYHRFSCLHVVPQNGAILTMLALSSSILSFLSAFVRMLM